jgi:hypothetical protein
MNTEDSLSAADRDIEGIKCGDFDWVPVVHTCNPSYLGG